MEGESKSRTFGRYALYDKIAGGGMATVHLGRLRGPVGFTRTVAIKRLRSHFAEEPEFVAMFLDEARLAARVRHPNVVPTLDVASVGGELLLVMEYVQGEALSKLLRAACDQDSPMPPAMVVTIMVGVLHGLHAAHEAKDEHGEPLHIVHRDVSPQNILVGVDGVPRVLDFGVAKAAGRLHTTRDGQVKGKLSYMAPEQVLSQKLDRRTDVYGASAVLWEALTGKRLFTGDNDGATLRNVLEGVVDPPSAHAPGISPEIDALTLRGLSRDPDARFASARDMARALEAAATAVVASVIGDWVEATAREELEGRSKLVELVESDPEGKWVWAPTNDAVSAGDATASLGGGAGEAESSAHTETSVVTSSEPRTSPTRVRSRVLIGAASLAGVAAFVAVGLGAMNHASQSNVAASPASPSAASATASSAVAVAPSFPSPTATNEPDPPTSSSAPRMQRAPIPPRPTSTRPPTPAKPPPKRYVFDHL